MGPRDIFDLSLLRVKKVTLKSQCFVQDLYLNIPSREYLFGTGSNGPLVELNLC